MPSQEFELSLDTVGIWRRREDGLTMPVFKGCQSGKQMLVPPGHYSWHAVPMTSYEYDSSKLANDYDRLSDTQFKSVSR